jgi:hypothetical protein
MPSAPEAVDLLGLSVGGRLALEFAASDPSGLRGQALQAIAGGATSVPSPRTGAA